MSANFPLVILSLVLSGFIPTVPAAIQLTDDKLICSYSDGFFRVSDGIRHWEKYVSNWDHKEAKLQCGEKIAAGLIGSYFVFFSDGQIKTHYVGSFDEDYRLVALNGDLAAAVVGAYFVSVRAGGEIIERIVGKAWEKPSIAISANFAATIIGTSFVYSDGLTMEEKYLGGGRDAQLVSGHSLIAASMGNYFVVLDCKRGEVYSRFTGAPGKVQVVEGAAIYKKTDAEVIRYSLDTGSFEE